MLVQSLKTLGADFAVNKKNSDYAAELLKAFGHDKAYVIYKCAGTDITMKVIVDVAPSEE